MRLQDDWKKAWKWISMQAMATAITVQTVWVSLPDDWKNSLNPSIVSGITIGCLVLGVFGRLYKQDV